MLDVEAGTPWAFSESKILAASCASTKVVAAEGDSRGSRCLVRKGGMEIALVVKTGLAFASFALCTPSIVVTKLSVAHEGHSTSLLCSNAFDVNFIGIAALSAPNRPKCS